MRQRNSEPAANATRLRSYAATEVQASARLGVHPRINQTLACVLLSSTYEPTLAASGHAYAWAISNLPR